ncbi:MAG: hypothetical protein V1716_03955 [Candidatus Uhrbacteria bacterium]
MDSVDIQPTNQEIMKEVKGLSSNFDNLSSKVDSLSSTVGNLSTTVNSLSSKVDSLSTTAESLSTTVNSLSSTVDNLSTTVQDVLETINSFASHTEVRFEKIENDISSIKNNMVTKEYLDDKLSDHKTDSIDLIRDEDKKLGALADKLVVHEILPLNDVQEVLAMKPFPQRTN